MPLPPPPPPFSPEAATTPERKRRLRKMTWVIIAWCVLILAWMIGGAANAKCEKEQYTDACEAGTAIGVGIVGVIGFMGFVVLALIWLMSRPKDRP